MLSYRWSSITRRKLSYLLKPCEAVTKYLFLREVGYTYSRLVCAALGLVHQEEPYVRAQEVHVPNLYSRLIHCIKSRCMLHPSSPRRISASCYSYHFSRRRRTRKCMVLAPNIYASSSTKRNLRKSSKLLFTVG